LQFIHGQQLADPRSHRRIVYQNSFSPRPKKCKPFILNANPRLSAWRQKNRGDPVHANFGFQPNFQNPRRYRKKRFFAVFSGIRGGSQWLAGRIHVRIRFWKTTARRLGNLRYDDLPG
jgi:hypothetical protein